MKNFRLTLMCLVGFACLTITTTAGCASTLDESARVLNTTALVVDDAAKAAAVADRLSQEAIIGAARARALSFAAAQADIATYRKQRAGVLQTTEQTRATLTSVAITLGQLPSAVAANDAFIDAELVSLQH